MHRLLKRQLDRLKTPFDGESVDIQTVTQEMLDQLLEQVSKTYEEDEESYNLLQNSLKISSAEMRTLYKQLQERSEKRLEAIITATPDLIVHLNDRGECLDLFAQGKEHLLFVPQHECINRSIFDIFDRAIAEKFHKLISEALRTDKLQTLEYELTINGEKKFFEARMTPVKMTENNHKMVVALIRDITKSKEQEYLNRLSEIVFEEATEGILVVDHNSIVVRINPAMLHFLGIKEGDALGEHVKFFEKYVNPDSLQMINDEVDISDHWHGEIKIQNANKAAIPAWMTVNTIRDSLGQITNFVTMVTDISELQLVHDKLAYLAMHDTLTKLPNRTLIFDRLELAIASAHRHQKRGALFFLDIDHFKEINDNYGHEYGDLVLQAFADRISSVMRASDSLGRLSGDEFLLIIDDINDFDGITQIAQKLISLFETPISIKNSYFYITISIGIALFPDDGKDPETLIHAADEAMYLAKKHGRNNFQFYSQDLTQLSKEHLMIREQLEEAIHKREFTILYQPHYSLTDGSLQGIEALLRCTATQMRNIPITRVIAVAEESKLINAIGLIVLDECCKQLEYWNSISPEPIRLAINLSHNELGDAELTQNIKQSLLMHQVNPSMIEFDITEKTLEQNNVIIKKNIDELFALGCQFSIDDFGANQTSFSSITDFQFHKLKINHSLISHLTDNPKDQSIVSAIISMAKKLGFAVLAVGVEDEKQAELLRKLECDGAQGYLFNRPLTADEITKIIIEKRVGKSKII